MTAALRVTETNALGPLCLCCNTSNGKGSEGQLLAYPIAPALTLSFKLQNI